MWTWYASRAAGVVSMVMLTATLLLGIVGVAGAATARWPRFVLGRLHRDLSLLAVSFVGLHVLTAVLDGYVPIRWVDVVLPFTAQWQPFWLGLGAIALDLFLAVSVTSLVRGRLTLGFWRGAHLAAYACWTAGVAHGLGLGGADSTTGWVLGLTVACVLAVIAGLAWRVALVRQGIMR